MPEITTSEDLESISARLSNVNIDELDESFTSEAGTVKTSDTINSDGELSGSSADEEEHSRLDEPPDDEDEDEGADSLHSSSSDEADGGAANDIYSDVYDDDDSLGDSLADASFAGSDYDELDESSSGGSDSEDVDEEEEAGDGSVDLEWEEAQEIVAAAVSSHTKVLKTAASEGLTVNRAKTITGVVEVVRSIVNTVGPFLEGPVNTEVILEHLRTSSELLLDENRRFVFENGQALINKYLSIVKYAYPDGVGEDSLLNSALDDQDIRDEEGRISLRLLVRRLKDSPLAK